jgi:uncharacterized membrane protein
VELCLHFPIVFTAWFSINKHEEAFSFTPLSYVVFQSILQIILIIGILKSVTCIFKCTLPDKPEGNRKPKTRAGGRMILKIMPRK